MKKLWYGAISLVIMGALLSGCGPLVGVVGGLGAPTATPTAQTATYVPTVQSVQVKVTEGNPPKVEAVARVMFAETCAWVGKTEVSRADKTFKITVYAETYTDRGCAPATDAFETSVPLDISGLAAGDYTVTVNGVSAGFTLKVATPTSTPVAQATDVPSVCTDAAAFVKDVSVPDNVLFGPGTAFTKTWRLKNTGSCAWTSDYLVLHVGGDILTQQPGYYFLQAGQRVEPGQTADVSVLMEAPVDTGYYTSYWGLKGRDGKLMPVSGGVNGNSFFVKIRVSDAGSPGQSGARIVDQSIEVELEQGSGEACTPGATYLVHAHVSADGPLSALYEIDSTAGQIAAGNFVDANTGTLKTTVEGTVKFDASLFAADGVQTITLPFRFVGPYPYPDDIQVNFWVDGGSWVSAKVQCP